jgi:hypothetical protein|nr:MAG TPA: hypothetical protein [Bacteriophage sp.]
MKDQYVIKLSDNHTTMTALEGIVNDVQAEVHEKDAYRTNAKSYIIPTTLGMLVDKCISITSFYRMVHEGEVNIAFRSELEQLYGSDFRNKTKSCGVRRTISTFIAPDVGTDWLKAEVYPNTPEYERLFGKGDKSHVVDVIAIKQVVMELEIEDSIHYGLTRTILVSDKAGNIAMKRIGFCSSIEEDIDNLKRYFDNMTRLNRWDENHLYDEIMSYHGVVSQQEEETYCDLAIKADENVHVPTKVMAYLETMADFLFQVVQGTNYNLPSKASNISLN